MNSILLGGALGRMGRQMTLLCRERGILVSCGIDPAATNEALSFPIVSTYEQAASFQADCLIDFSRPAALDSLLGLILQRGLPAVLCATGYTEAQLKQIDEAAKRVPILRSANMSLGVNVLLALCEQASRILREFDCEITETHHRMKADSPSGTALMLYDAVRRGRCGEAEATYGRHGAETRRSDGEVGIHAVRGGTVTGIHEVGFYGPGEHITLTHTAEDRSLFAQGALKAAEWLQNKPAGLYSMQDVIAEYL